MAGPRLHAPMLHRERHRSRRRVCGQSDWLGLLCRTLSFLIPSRFIPALSLTPFMGFSSTGERLGRLGREAFDDPLAGRAGGRMAAGIRRLLG